MPKFGPIDRRSLIAAFRRLGFEGPLSGGKHQFMMRGKQLIRIPNPHEGSISVGLLSRILKQADISRDEWESV